MIYNETLNGSLSDYKCNSCTLYILLFVIFLVTSIVISTVFNYFHCYLKKDNVRIKFYPCTQTTI